MQVFARSLVACWCASTVLFACGGSSSETPPPLEPHPLNLRYSRSSTTLDGAEPEPVAAKKDERRPEQQVPEEGEPAPAPRTWGAEPKRPAGLK